MDHQGRRGTSPMKSQHFWESDKVARRQESGHSFWQGTSQGERRRSLDFSNSTLHWFGLTTFIFMTIIVVLARGYVRNTSPLPQTAAQHAITELDRRASNSTPLVDFEVSPPVDVPSTNCQVTLIEYSFGNSYGQPFVGKCDAFPPPTCSYSMSKKSCTVKLAGLYSLQRISNPTRAELSRKQLVNSSGMPTSLSLF